MPPRGSGQRGEFSVFEEVLKVLTEAGIKATVTVQLHEKVVSVAAGDRQQAERIQAALKKAGLEPRIQAGYGAIFLIVEEE